MVIDAASGIESQTLKLFEVCRMRSVPLITFVNKVDREGRDPFELLAEVADKLALDVCPMSWPTGMGGQFEGVYDLGCAINCISRQVTANNMTAFRSSFPAWMIRNWRMYLSDGALERLTSEGELAKGGYSAFDLQAYQNGDLTPVFFGSALKQFGVEELIEAIAQHAPPPRPQPAEPEPVQPDDKDITGFIFKIQANMDPQHRDRIAFMRLCSGQFKRGMKLTPSGLGKPIAIHSPILFFAQDREIADTAEPGDIIGIPNHGTLRVGDTLSEKTSGADNRIAEFCARNSSPRNPARPDPDQEAGARRWMICPKKAWSRFSIPNSAPTGSLVWSDSCSWKFSFPVCRRNIRSKQNWKPLL